MRVCRCNKGHWFDADAYSACPHCNPSIAKTAPSENQMRKESAIPTEYSRFDRNAEPQIRYDRAFPDPKPNAFPPMRQENRPGEAFPAVPQNRDTAPNAAAGPKAPTQSPEPELRTAQASDIRRELQDVSNASVQKTVSYFAKISQTKGAADPDSRQTPTAENGAPVVGWLVCVSGAHIGQSFNIYAGKNSIGRGAENDIALFKDPTVSGSKHAWITYEAKHKNYILQAGDGRYPDLNGEQVIEGKLLKPFDKIEIGETVLLFVNLCGEHFAWEDYLNKE